MKRVVVTGMAGITSLGSDWASIEANFRANRSGIRRMHEWDRFAELNTRLAGPIDDFAVPIRWAGIIFIISSSGRSSSSMAVSIKPGATQLTVILRLPSSMASALAAPITPAFEAL